jgi:hypothetical protein
MEKAEGKARRGAASRKDEAMRCLPLDESAKEAWSGMGTDGDGGWWQWPSLR